MVNINDKAHAAQVISSLTSIGAEPPKPVAEAYARAQRVSDGVRSLAAPPDALPAAVAAALDDGRDPAEDHDVQRALASRDIANTGMIQVVDAIAFDRFRDTARDHADQIVGAWRGPFDRAVTTLTAAHERIGDVALEDTATIVQRGDDIAEVWAKAQAAVSTVTTASAGWVALGELTHLTGNDPRWRVLTIADVDAATWMAQGLERQRLTPWQAVLAGLTLSLPTYREYRDRVAAVVEGETRARHEAEQAAHDATTGRRPGAMVLPNQ